MGKGKGQVSQVGVPEDVELYKPVALDPAALIFQRDNGPVTPAQSVPVRVSFH